MQPIRTIWTNSVGDHPGTIPVEFGLHPFSGFQAVNQVFPKI